MFLYPREVDEPHGLLMALHGFRMALHGFRTSVTDVISIVQKYYQVT